MIYCPSVVDIKEPKLQNLAEFIRRPSATTLRLQNAVAKTKVATISSTVSLEQL